MSGLRDTIRNAFGTGRKSAAANYDLLPPEQASRPQNRSFYAANDVVDVHFVTLPARSTRRSGNDNVPGSQRPSLLLRVAARLESNLRRFSNDAYSAIVAAVSVAVFMICGGFSLVPGAEQAIIDRPLEFTHVSITPQDAGGMQVLLVNGIVENRNTSARALPAIRADVFADGQLIASTLITPPATLIGADNSRGFSAKLRHPGGKNHDVRLSFSETGVSRS